MKNLKIILPSLIAISSLPIVSLVSCNGGVEVDRWNGSNSCLESNIMDLESGKTYDFTVNMNKWPMTRDSKFYEYFSLYLGNGSASKLFLKLKENSIKLFIDGQELKEGDWTFSEGYCYFTNKEIISKILNAKKVSGTFTIEGAVEGTVSSGCIDFYGKWTKLTMVVKQTNGQPIPKSINVGESIELMACDSSTPSVPLEGVTFGRLSDCITIVGNKITGIKPTTSFQKTGIICTLVYYEDVIVNFEVKS